METIQFKKNKGVYQLTIPHTYNQEYIIINQLDFNSDGVSAFEGLKFNNTKLDRRDFNKTGNPLRYNGEPLKLNGEIEIVVELLGEYKDIVDCTFGFIFRKSDDVIINKLLKAVQNGETDY